jgi:Tfp pilus assembly protein PilX
MQKIASILNNPQGSIITMALIFLALLTVIGLATTHTSTTERKLTTNALLHNMAFYTADAGIEAGRAALTNLKTTDRGSWDVLLSNPSAADGQEVPLSCGENNECYNLNEVIDAGKGRTVGPTTFSLTIKDNDDRDNNQTIDTDDTVFLTSTASYRGSVITIEAIVQAGGGGSTYAQEHFDAASTGEASAESTVASDDVRWPVPE